MVVVVIVVMVVGAEICAGPAVKEGCHGSALVMFLYIDLARPRSF